MKEGKRIHMESGFLNSDEELSFGVLTPKFHNFYRRTTLILSQVYRLRKCSCMAQASLE